MVTPTLADSVRLDAGGVSILDRRVFPLERSWVRCTTVEDVAVAIEDMVTQSSGPLFAAAAGMVIAARQARDLTGQQAAAHLDGAAARLIATRPTHNQIRDAVRAILAAVTTETGDELVTSVTRAASAHADAYRARCAVLGERAAAFLPDGATVLTHCWADYYLMATVDAAQRAGKQLEFVCTETRPFLQGARLTAATLIEYGYIPTVITDGMAAAVLSEGRADVVLTAADRVTLDGHVVNKVGTLAVALAARAFGVPYYALVLEPDPLAPGIADVEIEHRDGAEVLRVLGRQSAAAGSRGYYPAFDVTPPGLVTHIITETGVFEPGREQPPPQ